jgi:type IV pilus assembly protein PilE
MNASNVKRIRQTGARGFTLMEVIVVMVMLGILAAIAIPNYSEYIRRGHRSAAQAYLLDLASRQVQFYLDRRVFADTVAALNLAAPTEIANRYTVAIAVAAGPPATFTITATPTGSQTGDRCGNLTIDQTGARGASGATTGCW